MAALGREEEITRLEATLARERDSLSDEAVQKLKTTFEAANAADDGKGPERCRPVAVAKFAYARALTNSTNRDEIRAGLVLLQELLDCGYEPSLCLFAMAVGHFRLGQLSDSRQYIERLARREPDNRDALVFHRMLRAKAGRDGKIGLAIVTVLAVGGLFLLRWALKPPPEPRFYQ